MFFFFIFKFILQLQAGNDDIDLSISGDNVNPDSFSFAASSTVTLTLFAIEDGDPLETLHLVLACSKQNLLTINIDIIPAPSAYGKSHLQQVIYDKKFKQKRNICYDIPGNASQVVHFFLQFKHTIQAVGQLRDDLYFHRVSIQLGRHEVYLETHRYVVSPYTVHNWNESIGNGWFKTGEIFMNCRKDFLLMRRTMEDKLSIGVRRRKNSLGKYYLDVMVYGLTTSYENQYGLFGIIGRRDLVIYPPTNPNDERREVTVNGHKTTGIMKKRNGMSCVLIDMKYLILPFKMFDFIA